MHKIEMHGRGVLICTLTKDVLYPVIYSLPTQIRAEIGWGSVL